MDWHTLRVATTHFQAITFTKTQRHSRLKSNESVERQLVKVAFLPKGKEEGPGKEISHRIPGRGVERR
jgi:hypothetical protein